MRRARPQTTTHTTNLPNYFDQEVETSLKAVTSMIEPITVMGAVVGGIALALLLPIFTPSKSAG